MKEEGVRRSKGIPRTPNAFFHRSKHTRRPRKLDRLEGIPTSRRWRDAQSLSLCRLLACGRFRGLLLRGLLGGLLRSLLRSFLLRHDPNPPSGDNLGGPSSTAGWRTGLSVSVSTNLSTESFPACQPWQTVCQFRLFDSSLVGCRGSDQFHEHLTINIKHEPTLNTPTSYRFQKILQDNCARFGHFLQKFFEIENRVASPSRVAQHHRAARADDEIARHHSKQRSLKTILFQVENIMFSRDASLRIQRTKSLTP